MDGFEVSNMVLSLAYVCIQVMICVQMCRKIKKTRLAGLAHVFLSFVAMVATALVMPFRTIWTPIITPVTTWFIITFLQAHFETRKASAFIAVVTTAAVLHVGVIVLKFFRDMAESPQLFFAYNLVMLGIFLLGHGRLGVACLASRARLARGGHVEPWIAYQYALIAISAILVVIGTAIPIFFENTTMFHEDIAGLVAKLVQASCFLGFSIASYLAWFVPEGLRHRVNAGFGPIQAMDPRDENALLDEKFTEQLDKMRVTAIIDYLGDKLAPLIGKSPGAAKGLLLVTLESEQRAPTVALLDLHHIITGALAASLERLGYRDASEITSKLANELVRNQSLVLLLSL